MIFRTGNSLNVPHDEHFDWPLRFGEFQPKLMGQVKSSLRLRQLTRCRIVVAPFKPVPSTTGALSKPSNARAISCIVCAVPIIDPCPPPHIHFSPFMAGCKLRGRIPEGRKHIDPLHPLFSLDTQPKLPFHSFSNELQQ